MILTLQKQLFPIRIAMFNIKKYIVLLAECIFVFFMDLTINNNPPYSALRDSEFITKWGWVYYALRTESLNTLIQYKSSL